MRDSRIEGLLIGVDPIFNSREEGRTKKRVDLYRPFQALFVAV